jgi:flagellar hook-associated protein 2
MSGVTDAVTATAIDNSSTTTKLTVTSNKTGLAYKVALADVSGTLVSATGVGAATAATDTVGGYIYADTALDAKFTLNGVNMTRSGNTVSDALTGVTLTLKATQDVGDANVTLTVGADTGAIRTEMDAFIKEYNDVVKYMTLKTAASSSARGELAGDFTFRNLLVQLRSKVASGVTGVSNAAYDRLSLIGITFANDGTLSVGDSSKLEAAMKDGTLKEIFNTSSTGIGHQVNTLIDGFVVTGGILSDHQSILDTRMKNIDNQVKTLNERLDKRAKQLKEQYASIQESILLLRGQASTFGLFGSQLGQ